MVFFAKHFIVAWVATLQTASDKIVRKSHSNNGQTSGFDHFVTTIYTTLPFMTPWSSGHIWEIFITLQDMTRRSRDREWYGYINCHIAKWSKPEVFPKNRGSSGIIHSFLWCKRLSNIVLWCERKMVKHWAWKKYGTKVHTKENFTT